MKIGDKIKVTLRCSIFYGEILELVETDSRKYYFTNENHPRGRFVIGHDETAGYERLERENNDS